MSWALLVALGAASAPWGVRCAALGVAGLGGGVVYAVLLVRADLEDLRPAVAAGRRAVDKLCAKLRLL